MNTQMLFNAITKMEISQNALGREINTTPSTVNAWIKKGSQPQLDADTIFKGIDICREKYTTYKQDYTFISELINKMMLSKNEQSFFTYNYNTYKSQHNNDETCYTKCMLDLIKMSLNKETCPSVLLSFNPSKSIIGIGIEHIIGVRDDGRVLSTGSNDFQQCNTYSWRNIVSVCAGWRNSIGLKNDGTCIAIGNNVIGNGEIFRWDNITAIASGIWHILGLKSDGSVVAFGRAGEGQCDISDWKNITAIAAGQNHSVGLKADGTVVCSGNNDYGQCNVSSWQNITAVAAGGDHTIGLSANGRIFAAGDVELFHFDDWKDIISLATGTYHAVGLKKDGTVTATGHQANGQCDVYKWQNIIAIYAGFFSTVGIQADGHVISTRCKYERNSGTTNTNSWKLFEGAPNTKETISKFDSVRAQVYEQLTQIKLKLLAYAPFINQYSDPGNIHSIKHTKEFDSLFFELYRMSKDIWAIYEAKNPLPPITDLLLQYNTAFADFYNTLIISYDPSLNKPTSYDPTVTSYEAFVTLFNTINNVLKDLKTC